MTIIRKHNLLYIKEHEVYASEHFEKESVNYDVENDRTNKERKRVSQLSIFKLCVSFLVVIVQRPSDQRKYSRNVSIDINRKCIFYITVSCKCIYYSICFS